MCAGYLTFFRQSDKQDLHVTPPPASHASAHIHFELKSRGDAGDEHTRIRDVPLQPLSYYGNLARVKRVLKDLEIGKKQKVVFTGRTSN